MDCRKFAGGRINTRRILGAESGAYSFLDRLRTRERHLFFSSKDNRTVKLTRQDFLPDHTADGDLLFIFSQVIF